MPLDPTVPPGVRLAGIGDEAAVGMREQIAAITRLGWNSIELRNVDGAGIADLTEPAFARLAGALADAGLRVPCVDSRIANWARPVTHPFVDDLAELEVISRRCAVLGTKYVRIMSYPNDGLDDAEWRREVLRRIRELARQAEHAGVVLLHENCVGWAGRSAENTLDLLAAVDSPALALLFDIGNGVAYGYAAHEMLSRVVDWVRHVHVKDAAGDATAPVYTMPGEGHSRVAECLRLLLRHGYAGAWSIEPHLQVRPHQNRAAAGSDTADLFVAYGRALERLIREVAPPAEAASALSGPGEGR
jgi:sugar phosphate isomerase/epimerase